MFHTGITPKLLRTGGPRTLTGPLGQHLTKSSLQNRLGQRRIFVLTSGILPRANIASSKRLLVVIQQRKFTSESSEKPRGEKNTVHNDNQIVRFTRTSRKKIETKEVEYVRGDFAEGLIFVLLIYGMWLLIKAAGASIIKEANEDEVTALKDQLEEMKQVNRRLAQIEDSIKKNPEETDLEPTETE